MKLVSRFLSLFSMFLSVFLASCASMEWHKNSAASPRAFLVKGGDILGKVTALEVKNNLARSATIQNHPYSDRIKLVPLTVPLKSVSALESAAVAGYKTKQTNKEMQLSAVLRAKLMDLVTKNKTCFLVEGIFEDYKALSHQYWHFTLKTPRQTVENAKLEAFDGITKATAHSYTSGGNTSAYTTRDYIVKSTICFSTNIDFATQFQVLIEPRYRMRAQPVLLTWLPAEE